MAEWAEELAELDGAEGLERKLRDMKAARERMISCNLRLVLHIARRKFYTGKSGTLKVLCGALWCFMVLYIGCFRPCRLALE